MLYEICVVESPGIAPQWSVGRLLTPESGFRCRVSSWAGFAHQSLAPATRLVVAVVSQLDSEVVEFFRAIRSTRHGRSSLPTVAVVPQDVSDDLLQQVLDGSDDFVFWPARTQELQKRVLRLLDRPKQTVDPDRELRQITLTLVWWSKNIAS